MAANFGVVANFTSSSARPISVASTTVIGIVGVSDVIAEGLYYYGSPAAALEAEFADAADDLLATLQFGQNLNIAAPTVIAVAAPGADAAAKKANLIAAATLLKSAEAEYGYRPDVMIAPTESEDIDVANALISAAGATLGRCYVDLSATDEAAAILERENFSSMRVTLCNPAVKYPDGTDAYVGMSALMGWMRLYVDGLTETGWAQSVSNREISISATERVIGFTPGETSEADRLRAAGITTLIRYSGWRTWGEQTCATDSIWQDARRVRIFDMLVAKTLEGIFWAVDRDLSELSAAKQSIKEFLNELKGADVLLGFEVYLDTEKTTATSITEGKFYFIAETQEMPVARRIEVTFDRVDTYASVVYDILAA